MSLTPGTRLGPYEILSPIGAGGMGEVYRARDTKLDRDVAIKVLREEFAADPERLARFEREAKLLASLNHPNIASIHGFEESDGVNALVLELVEGPTLAERITEGPIPVDEAIIIAKQIAEALEAGHEAGVIHRDLKPANIKLREDGTVKVLDYGLAKALEAERASSGDAELSQSPTLTRHGTQVGVILGTAAYMSPEQAKGKTVDERSDIWAFGTVLYEMLTGKRAFPGEDVSDTLAAVLRAEPNWDELPKPTPPHIRRSLQMCLRKDAKHRMHDIADVRIELDEPILLATGSASEPTFRFSMIGAGIAGALLAAVLLLWLAPESSVSSGRIVRMTFSIPNGEALAYYDSIAISPDGTKIALAAGENEQLFVRPIDSLEAQPMPDTAGVEEPFFSPDGRFVAFFQGDRLRKVPTQGGSVADVASDVDVRFGGTWSDAGFLYVGAGISGGILSVPEGGGDPTQLTQLDPERGDKTHRHPHLLPGDEAILVTTADYETAEYGDAKIEAITLETGERKTLVDGGMHASYAPSGHLVFAREGALYAVAFDAERLEVSGEPVLVLEGVRTLTHVGQAFYALSREGTLVYARGDGSEPGRRLVWVDRSGNIEPILDDLGYIYRPVLSPDGMRVAVAVLGANGQIWKHDLSRGVSERVTHSYDNIYPSWTPDGVSISFSRFSEGTSAIYKVAADGSGAPERLTPTNHAVVSSHTWSPDGRTLVYATLEKDSSRDLWALDVSKDGDPKPLLQRPLDQRYGRLSPDGRWLAYLSNESGGDHVYVQPYPALDARQRISTGSATSLPLWAPDGSEIFYREENCDGDPDKDCVMAVSVSTRNGFSAGRPERLFAGDFGSGWDVAPDDKRFLMIETGRQQVTELTVVLNWHEELKRLVPVE